MPPRERLEPPSITPLERQLLVSSHEQQRPDIQPVPKSSVLDKLKTFLPRMQQANVELQQKLQSCNPAEVDIEHIPEGSDEQIVQMDLACGLLELRDDAAVAAAQRAIAAGGEIAVETYDGGDSSDSDSSSSDDEDAAAEDPGGGVSNMEEVQAAGAGAGAGTGSSLQPSGVSSSEQLQQHQAEEQQQQQQKQQRQRTQEKRRKVKAKRPMIVELNTS